MPPPPPSQNAPEFVAAELPPFLGWFKEGSERNHPQNARKNSGLGIIQHVIFPDQLNVCDRLFMHRIFLWL